MAPQTPIKPGSIIRLDFFFRPDINEQNGKIEIRQKKLNGKARNGVVLETEEDLLRVLPISHLQGSVSTEVPSRILRNTTHLDEAQPSWVSCDEINEIRQGNSAMHLPRSPRHANRWICGYLDPATMTSVEQLVDETRIRDQNFAIEFAEQANAKSPLVRNVFAIRRPMWVFTHPNDSGQDEMKRLRDEKRSRDYPSPD